MKKIARRIAHALKGEKTYLATIAVSGLMVQAHILAPNQAHAMQQAEYMASGGYVVACDPV